VDDAIDGTTINDSSSIFLCIGMNYFMIKEAMQYKFKSFSNENYHEVIGITK
jgi:hypothetical protein